MVPLNSRALSPVEAHVSYGSQPLTPEPEAVSGRLDEELWRIIEARHHDPFAVLGRHRRDG